MSLEPQLQFGQLLAAVVTAFAISSVVGMLVERLLGVFRKRPLSRPVRLDPARSNRQTVVQPLSVPGQRPPHIDITLRPLRVAGAWYHAPARSVPSWAPGGDYRGR